MVHIDVQMYKSTSELCEAGLDFEEQEAVHSIEELFALTGTEQAHG